MPEVYHLYGDRAPAADRKSASKAKTPKATDADIQRSLRAATRLGLTIYGYTVDGNRVHVHTKPLSIPSAATGDEADAWLARHG